MSDDKLVEVVALAMAKEIGWGTFSHFNPDDMRRLARAAIDAMPERASMEGEIERLRDALEPFAAVADLLEDYSIDLTERDDFALVQPGGCSVTDFNASDFFDARAALTSSKTGDER